MLSPRFDSKEANTYLCCNAHFGYLYTFSYFLTPKFRGRGLNPPHSPPPTTVLLFLDKKVSQYFFLLATGQKLDQSHNFLTMIVLFIFQNSPAFLQNLKCLFYQILSCQAISAITICGRKQSVVGTYLCSCSDIPSWEQNNYDSCQNFNVDWSFLIF